MTVRQKLLKLVYPLFIKFAGGKNNKIVLENKLNTVAPESFYNLKSEENNGRAFSFEQLKGKKVLLVNTASDCGYTAQYDGLEKLYEQYNKDLVVIGFPANDFKEQEKADDNAIAEFCKINFGVTFPLMKKSSVVKNDHQSKIFQWLTDASKNGWNTQAPTWNFCKYLVDENGRLTHFFNSNIEPLDAQIISGISHDN